LILYVAGGLLVAEEGLLALYLRRRCAAVASELAAETAKKDSERREIRMDQAELLRRDENQMADGEGVPAAAPQHRSSFQDQFVAAMKDPAFLARLDRQQAKEIGLRYAPLFRKLGLAGAGLDQVEEIIAQGQRTKTVVLQQLQGEAGEAGNASGALRAVADAQQPENDSLRQILGAEGYQQFEVFERSGGIQNLVRTLSDSVSYTSEPLTDAQKAALVGLWSREPSASASPTGLGAIAGAGLSNGGEVPARIPLNQDREVRQILSERQYEALTQMEQVQTAQRKLSQIGGLRSGP
jgi:hypothetical protein